MSKSSSVSADSCIPCLVVILIGRDVHVLVCSAWRHFSFVIYVVDLAVTACDCMLVLAECVRKLVLICRTKLVYIDISEDDGKVRRLRL